MGRGRRPDQLWAELPGHPSPGRHLRRKDPQRREACRSPGPAADEIRAGRQSQDGQDARPYSTAVDPRPRRRGHRMRRRDLILLLGGAMTAARTLHAQKAMPVIGFLGLTSPGPFAPFMTALHQGLNEAGFIEGENVAIEYRWAEDRNDRLPALAADLAARKVDVIVTSGGTPPARAAKDATRSEE